MNPDLKAVTDGRVAIGPGHPLFVTAGLCIVEEEEATLRQAEAGVDLARSERHAAHAP